MTTTTTSLDPQTIRRPALAVIIGLLLLRTVLLFVGDGVTYGISRGVGESFGQALMYANVYIVAVDVITVLAVVALLRRQGRTVRDLVAVKSIGRDTAWGLLVFVITMVALLVATFVGNLVVFQGAPPAGGAAFAPPLWLGLWSLIIMPVTVAVAEELAYRGYAQGQLTDRFGRTPALLITAAFFGLQHAALSATGWQDMLSRTIAMFLAGLVFGLLRNWFKRLLPLIIGHWLLDVIGLGVPMLAAALALR